MSFVDTYPAAPPLVQRQLTPIELLGNKIEYMLDHCIEDDEHGAQSFPATGIPLDELNSLCAGLTLEDHAVRATIQLVPVKLQWMLGGPARSVTIYF